MSSNTKDDRNPFRYTSALDYRTLLTEKPLILEKPIRCEKPLGSLLEDLETDLHILQASELAMTIFKQPCDQIISTLQARVHAIGSQVTEHKAAEDFANSVRDVLDKVAKTPKDLAELASSFSEKSIRVSDAVHEVLVEQERNRDPEERRRELARYEEMMRSVGQQLGLLGRWDRCS
ncbi:MAG: hypothetical protein Q9199_003999 [Rusavskia elegans]